MAMTIKVDSSVLQNKAQDITQQIGRIENALKAISEQISSSKNYWKGDASDSHQKKYKALDGDTQNVLKELKAHPKNLLTMAGLYGKTENQALAEANSLPTDVIS